MEETQVSNVSFAIVNFDVDLFSLHSDNRWKIIINQVKKNKDSADLFLNNPICRILDTILKDDQADRKKIDEFILKYGDNSVEVRTLFNTINEKDIINISL